LNKYILNLNAFTLTGYPEITRPNAVTAFLTGSIERSAKRWFI